MRKYNYNDKPLIPTWMTCGLLLVCIVMLVSCMPTPVKAHEYHQERWHNALIQEANGSVFTAEEIMQLHYCNDLHIRTGAECPKYAPLKPYFSDRYETE